MKLGIRDASILAAAGLLLVLAWLLAGGSGAALAAAPAAAATGTPTASPTILPTPTSIVLPKDSISPAGPQMIGFVIAATLTCGATVVAVIVAAFSLMALLRGGYGPFLRTLVYGPQARGGGTGPSANDEFLPRRAEGRGRSGRRPPTRSRRGRRG